MKVFIDTSAIYAALVRTDRMHAEAGKKLAELCGERRATLVTTSFVTLETFSLLQARFGLETALRFDQELCPHLDVVHVDKDLYQRGIRRVSLRKKRKVSLVDCISFIFMEEQGIPTAFALDKHFTQEGFQLY